MALHHMVWDGAAKTSKVIYLSPEEEAVQVALWVMEDEKQRTKPVVLTDKERLAAVEAQLAKIIGGV